jgi:hypothetical protein
MSRNRRRRPQGRLSSATSFESRFGPRAGSRVSRPPTGLKHEPDARLGQLTWVLRHPPRPIGPCRPALRCPPKRRNVNFGVNRNQTGRSRLVHTEPALITTRRSQRSAGTPHAERTCVRSTCGRVRRFHARHAGRLLPARFVPVSLSALDDRDFFLLGTLPCPAGRCYAIERTADASRSFTRVPAPTSRWTQSPLPFTPDGPVFDLAARGRDVWLLATPRTRFPRHDLLAGSTDGGRTFVTGTGPCIPGLGGDLEPSSSRVVWAVCPTGMMAGALRSTDGGATFTPLRTPPLVNSARLAPASNRTAVLAANGAGRPLYRPTDGGATWRPTAPPGKDNYWSEVVFTGTRVGDALVQVGARAAGVLADDRRRRHLVEDPTAIAAPAVACRSSPPPARTTPTRSRSRLRCRRLVHTSRANLDWQPCAPLSAEWGVLALTESHSRFERSIAPSWLTGSRRSARHAEGNVPDAHALGSAAGSVRLHRAGRRLNPRWNFGLHGGRRPDHLHARCGARRVAASGARGLM